MNKRQFLTFILLWLSCLAIHAQDVQVKFESKAEPMTVPMQRKDLNGDLCALVKVLLPQNDVAFEGNVIGKVTFRTNEYWVYMSPNSQYLRIKIPGRYPVLVNFTQYGIEGVESKGIYELLVKIANSSDVHQDITVPTHLSLACRNKETGERIFLSPDRWKNEKEWQEQYQPLGMVVIHRDVKCIVALEESIYRKWGLTTDVRDLQNFDTDRGDVIDRDGYANSKAIYNANPFIETAAVEALQYKAFPEDQTIWYLPSMMQLRIIMDEWEDINQALEACGVASHHLLQDSYWSSAEKDEKKAWMAQYNGRYCQWEAGNKGQYGHVRAVTDVEVKEKTYEKVESFSMACYDSEKEEIRYFSKQEWQSLTLLEQIRLRPIGVALVTPEHQLIVASGDAAEGKEVKWSTYRELPLLTNYEEKKDGDYNTTLLRKKNIDLKKFPAALAALEYKPRKGVHWYLPSWEQLEVIHEHRKQLNDTLQSYFGEQARMEGDYWTSSIRREDYVRAIRISKDADYQLIPFWSYFNYYKGYKCKVRAVTSIYPLKKRITSEMGDYR